MQDEGCQTGLLNSTCILMQTVLAPCRQGACVTTCQSLYLQRTSWQQHVNLVIRLSVTLIHIVPVSVYTQVSLDPVRGPQSDRHLLCRMATYQEVASAAICHTLSLHAGHFWILREAVNQIDNYSVLDCLQNLLGAADQSPGNAPASDLQWLTSTTVLPDLLSKYASLHQFTQHQFAQDWKHSKVDGSACNVSVPCHVLAFS